MAKHPEREFMWHCGVESCKEGRVIGTAYCAKHTTIESRAGIRSVKVTWMWVAMTGIPAVWCLYYAQLLLGATCENVTFNWGSALTSAFTCTAEDPSSGGFSWLSAPGGTTLGAALAIGGFGLAMIAVFASVALWQRYRGTA